MCLSHCRPRSNHGCSSPCSWGKREEMWRSWKAPKHTLRMYLLHSWRRLEAGTSITKGYERSLSAQGWEWIIKGYMPRLEAFEGFLLTTCFWEQGLLIHDKTPFRVSPKLCYVLGGGNCILCLNAFIFIEKGYMQVCFMFCSLRP